MSTPEQRYELKMKSRDLIVREFGGDYEKAFSFYDRNGDDKINRTELIHFLEDANIGNGIGLGLLRQAWADGIMAEVDTDVDGLISRSEFNTTIGR